MFIGEGNNKIAIKAIKTNEYDPDTFTSLLPAGSKPSKNDWDMISVEIVTPESKHLIALVCETSVNDVDCAVLNDLILSVLQGFTIYHINIDTGNLTGTTEIDSLCPNYNLYRIKEGYIVFGELDVTMLDHDFNFLWSFSGDDVFCPVEEGLKPIELCEDKIKLYDFNGDYYELSYNGDLLYNRKTAEH